MAGREREFRETVGDGMVAKAIEGMSAKWSDYKLVMGPEGSSDMMERAGSGYKISDLSFLKDECGIYEFAIETQHGEKPSPVYLGSTCRCREECKTINENGCGLKTRIAEYSQHGSHKATVINQAIDHGMKIYVSTRKVRHDVEGWEKKEKAARAAEDALLEKYDYAWNIRGNDKDIPRSVKKQGVKKENKIVGHSEECPFCRSIGL